jgi:SAM-dependent methyltransferase
MPVNEDTLNELIGQFVTDFGAAMHGATVVIGDKLGLYKALAAKGPVTGEQLATATGYDQRLVEEWCNAQFVSGYCQYDAISGRFSLSEEQAAVLADESTPAFLAGAMTLAASMYKDEELVRLAFGSGAGVGWHAHDDDLFHGVERLFKPGYLGSLVAEWIPALDGVDERLRASGASIADIGCGHGASTILLAREYPDAKVIGYDNHEESINEARRRAAEAGVADRARFQVASAQDFPGSDYDLVCIFDALHDMGDPQGAARHIGESLAPDGTWMLVEPSAAGPLEDNVNPVSRIYYSGSVGICTPAAQAQSGGFALGNQVDDDRWRQLLGQAGFTRFRRATETPFNRIFEVRK